MNLQFYLQKLKDSESYKKFMEENSDAFICSGFFIIDKQENNDQQHFDFFIPSKKELVTFCVNDACQKNPSGMIDKNQSFEKIPEDCDFNFEQVEKLIIDEMAKKSIKQQIQKILLSLQAKEGKCSLLITIFISTLGLIKSIIELEEMKIIDFEKKSFFDIMNVFKK